jgi:mRNA interferase HigB
MLIVNAQPLLTAFVTRYPRAERPLAAWVRVTEGATWRHIMDVRRDFPGADAVKVNSGNVCIVFNIGGNKWRLITLIDYTEQIVVVGDVLTHAEYDKEQWKRRL